MSLQGYCCCCSLILCCFSGCLKNGWLYEKIWGCYCETHRQKGNEEEYLNVDDFIDEDGEGYDDDDDNSNYYDADGDHDNNVSKSLIFTEFQILNARFFIYK